MAAFCAVGIALLCAAQTPSYTYTNEQYFIANQKKLESSWPYGDGTPTAAFTPKTGTDTKISVCSNNVCSRITFELASIEECDATVLHPETKNPYRLNRAASNYVMTDGAHQFIHGKSQFPKRVEANGNILDLANASASLLAKVRKQYPNNAYKTQTGLVYDSGSLLSLKFKNRDGNLVTSFENTETADAEGSLAEIYESCEQRSTWFNSLPFWASDNAVVPVCMYMLDMSIPNVDKEVAIQPYAVNDAMASNASFAENQCPAPDFSGLLAANFDVECKAPPGDTVVLPGRCTFFDTNYLFRQSSTELVFDWSTTSQNTYALKVYGRSQCNPQYGGKLVSFKDEGRQIEPPRGTPLNSTFFFDGYTIDNYGMRPQQTFAVRSGKSVTDACGENEVEVVGTKLNLPLESFMRWEDTGSPNPNPLYFFKGRGEWEDGNPAGLIDPDTRIHCQRFTGPFPPDSPVQPDAPERYRAFLQDNAVSAADEALIWAASGKPLTHEDSTIVQHLLNADLTAPIPPPTLTTTSKLSFYAAHQIIDIIQNELNTGKMLLDDIFPSGGTPGLTDAILQKANATELNVPSLLLFLEFTPKAADAFRDNHASDPAGFPPNTNGRDQLYNVYGQTAATDFHIDAGTIDPWNHVYLGAGLNSFPQIFPDTWAAFNRLGCAEGSNEAYCSAGATTDWNSEWGIPTLVFHTGSLTVRSPFGALWKLTNQKNDSSSYGSTDAQTQNVFACDLGHIDAEFLESVSTNSCPRINAGYKDPTTPFAWFEQVNMSSVSQPCFGTLTFLAPAYGKDDFIMNQQLEIKRRPLPNQCDGTLADGSTISRLRDVGNSTPCMNPAWDYVNCRPNPNPNVGPVEWNGFTGGLNPSTQSCNNEQNVFQPNKQRSERYRAPVYQRAYKSKIDPCELTLTDKYVADTLEALGASDLSESDIVKDMFVATYPLPRHCGVLEQEIESKATKDLESGSMRAMFGIAKGATDAAAASFLLGTEILLGTPAAPAILVLDAGILIGTIFANKAEQKLERKDAIETTIDRLKSINLYNDGTKADFTDAPVSRFSPCWGNLPVPSPQKIGINAGRRYCVGTARKFRATQQKLYALTGGFRQLALKSKDSQKIIKDAIRELNDLLDSNPNPSQPPFLDKTKTVRKQITALQFGVQHNEVDWASIDNWDPLRVSIGSAIPNAADTASKVLLEKMRLGGPSGVDGPEAMHPNIVASESGDGLAFGALEVLTLLYNANPNVKLTWANIYKELACAQTTPAWATRTTLPQTTSDWIAFLNETTSDPVYHDCSKQIPSMYGCDWDNTLPKPPCAYFSPYNEKIPAEDEKDYLIIEGGSPAFYKNHACPVQAGCMVRPYGRVVGKTYTNAETPTSELHQEFYGHMCSPAIWQTFVYPMESRAKSEFTKLYQPDPGVSMAMRRQKIFVTIQDTANLINPPDNSEHKYQSIRKQESDYFFYDSIFTGSTGAEAIYYRLDIRQRTALQSLDTQEFPDISTVSCPVFVSRRNWNIRVPKSGAFYDGPEVFKVIPIDNTQLPQRSIFDTSQQSPYQIWLKIEYASQYNIFTPQNGMRNNIGYGLSFACECKGCDPVPFFKSQPVPAQYTTGNYAFSENCNSPACILQTGANFADPRFVWQPAFSVSPYALTPPVAFSPKAVPQFETTHKTQYQAISDGDDASCSCGGLDSIKFFCEAQPTQFYSTNTTVFSQATTSQFGAIQFPAKASASFIACGYSWTDNTKINVPNIGLFMGSMRKGYTVAERNIMLDGLAMNNPHTRDHLEGTTGAKPDFAPQSDDGLQKRYWFTGNQRPFQDDLSEARRLYDARVVDYSMRLQLEPQSVKADVNPATHLCGFETCLQDENCKKQPYKVQPNQKYNYTNTRNTVDTLLCWRRWYYEYSFDNGCTKWPYGFVQSFEMSESDRDAFFPPSTEPPDYLMSYCDTFSVGGADRFNFCNGDPFDNSRDLRLAFCDPKQNPMGQYRLDAVMITDHPIDAACSDRLKACLIIPDSPGASSFQAVLNDAPKGKYTNYTLFLAPFNFLAVANSFGYLSRRGSLLIQDSGSGRDMSNTNVVGESESRDYLGFQQSDEIFNMFLNIDSVGSKDDIKRLCQELVTHLESAQPGDGKFCLATQYRVLAVSNSKHAYRCVEKDWWKAGDLTEREIIVRDDGITFEYAGPGTGQLVFTTSPDEASHESCVRIEVGGQRFSLPNVAFDQTHCRLKNPDLADRLTPIKFSGGNADGAIIHMEHIPAQKSPDHAAVMMLGDETTFFGHHPTIQVDGITLSVKSTVRYALAAARAEGTIDITCLPGPDCTIILQQPNETFKPVYFTSRNKLDIVDIGNYTNIFGTTIEKRLTSRPVDHSTTAWIFTAFLGLLFLLQCAAIILTAVDPHLVESMLVEVLFGPVHPYTGQNSRVFVYDGKGPLVLTRTSPNSFVWSSHYSNQVDASGSPKKGALVVETHFVTSGASEYQYTSSTYYHLAYDFRVECIKKDGAIPVPHSLTGPSPGLRTVPIGLYHALINA